MLRCNKCSKELGSFKKAPLDPNMKWVWLHTPAFKTRLVFCGDCEPDEAALKNLPFDQLKAYNIIPHKEMHFGESVPLDEYCSMLNGGNCSACGKHIEDNEKIRNAWKLFHKKCLGVFENRYKQN